MTVLARPSKNFLHLFILTISVLLGSACSTAGTRLVADSSQPRQSPCPDSYGYLEAYAEFSTAQLQNEMLSIKKALDTDGNYCASMRLAVLMMTPHPLVQSDEKSLQLFGKLLTDGRLNGRDRTFIRTQQKHLEQRERLRQEAQAGQNQQKQQN